MRFQRNTTAAAVSLKKVERQKQNARIALQFFIVLITVVSCLGLYSRGLEGGRDAELTLDASQEHGARTETRTDPLDLCSNKSGFELLAMSSDQSVIGYSSSLSTGQAALGLIDCVSGRGWQIGSQTAMEPESGSSNEEVRGDHEQDVAAPKSITSTNGLEGRTEAFALVFTSGNASLGGYRQMMVQLFPVVDGCSIVVRLY